MPLCVCECVSVCVRGFGPVFGQQVYSLYKHQREGTIDKEYQVMHFYREIVVDRIPIKWENQTDGGVRMKLKREIVNIFIFIIKKCRANMSR